MGNPLCKPNRIGESLREFLQRKFSKRLDKRTLEETVDDVLREVRTQEKPPTVEPLVLEDLENDSLGDVNSCQSARPEPLQPQKTIKISTVYGKRVQAPEFKPKIAIHPQKTEREVRVETVSSGGLSTTRFAKDVIGGAHTIHSGSVTSQISDNGELPSESQFLYTKGAHVVPIPSSSRKESPVVSECSPTKRILVTPLAITSVTPSPSPIAFARQTAVDSAGSQNTRLSTDRLDGSSVMLRGGIQQGLRTRNQVSGRRQSKDTGRTFLSLEEKMQKLKKRDPSMPRPDKGIVWPKSLGSLNKTNAAYYVEQFLRSELFRQRCLRKLQGSKTWKNGLTPFQLWVIENEDTDVIEDVLHPFRTKSNNVRAKVVCWRGHTPPTCTEN